MVINTYPDDPLATDTLVDLCDNTLDQTDNVNFACRLPQDGLGALTLDDDSDRDLFLLEGTFDGAFIRGQTFPVTVTTDPNQSLFVELRTFRARAPLAVASEEQPGVWTLTWTVPNTYSGRYFAVHVAGAGVTNLGFDLTVEVQ